MIGAIFQLRYVFFDGFKCYDGKTTTTMMMMMMMMVCDWFSGKKPDFLGVQKNERLALCPATNNCISTSENISDRVHYAPPW